MTTALAQVWLAWDWTQHPRLHEIGLFTCKPLNTCKIIFLTFYYRTVNWVVGLCCLVTSWPGWPAHIPLHVTNGAWSNPKSTSHLNQSFPIGVYSITRNIFCITSKYFCINCSFFSEYYLQNNVYYTGILYLSIDVCMYAEPCVFSYKIFVLQKYFNIGYYFRIR